MESSLTSLWKTPVHLCLGMSWGCRGLVKGVVSGPRGLGPNSPHSQRKPQGPFIQSLCQSLTMVGSFPPLWPCFVSWKALCNLTTPLLLLSYNCLHHLRHTTTNALSMSVHLLSNVSLNFPYPQCFLSQGQGQYFFYLSVTLTIEEGCRKSRYSVLVDRWSPSPVDSQSQWINKCYI